MAAVAGEGALANTQDLRRRYCLGTFALPLEDKAVFVDFEDPDVARFIREHDILPQRKVLAKNVKALSEALKPGSLENRCVDAAARLPTS